VRRRQGHRHQGQDGPQLVQGLQAARDRPERRGLRRPCTRRSSTFATSTTRRSSSRTARTSISFASSTTRRDTARSRCWAPRWWTRSRRS
jgi:hypothetical protein